jgi:hypothetical protein
VGKSNNFPTIQLVADGASHDNCKVDTFPIVNDWLNWAML